MWETWGNLQGTYKLHTETQDYWRSLGLQVLYVHFIQSNRCCCISMYCHCHWITQNFVMHMTIDINCCSSVYEYSLPKKVLYWCQGDCQLYKSGTVWSSRRKVFFFSLPFDLPQCWWVLSYFFFFEKSFPIHGKLPECETFVGADAGIKNKNGLKSNRSERQTEKEMRQ